MCIFQKSKDHFLEVKVESSRQHYFHLRSDFAYVQVSSSLEHMNPRAVAFLRLFV